MSATTRGVTDDRRFRRGLEEGNLFCRERELIEEVSRREEWTWAKWFLILGIFTSFPLGVQLW